MATRNTLSYIDQPNERGQGCNFCAACLVVGNGGAKGLPNMLYYHLGALAGSVCDSLTVVPEVPNWESIRVYPNPFSNELRVFLPLPENTEVELALYNLLGQRVRAWDMDLDATQHLSLDMRGLAQSIYILKIEAGGMVWKEKIVRE